MELLGGKLQLPLLDATLVKACVLSSNGGMVYCIF
jgi:hypothetical protein